MTLEKKPKKGKRGRFLKQLLIYASVKTHIIFFEGNTNQHRIQHTIHNQQWSHYRPTSPHRIHNLVRIGTCPRELCFGNTFRFPCNHGEQNKPKNRQRWQIVKTRIEIRSEPTIKIYHTTYLISNHVFQITQIMATQQFNNQQKINSIKYPWINVPTMNFAGKTAFWRKSQGHGRIKKFNKI